MLCTLITAAIGILFRVSSLPPMMCHRPLHVRYNVPPGALRELSNPPSDGISNLCFSNHNDHLLVSSWETSMRLYDAGENVLKRESSLKCQTRCVRAYPNGTGYALSSMAGRISMEFFDLSEAGQVKKYAFKYHHKSETGRDIINPANVIAFHPIYGTFATGDCDGYVHVWDGNKKRLYQYSKCPTSVAASSFSRDGCLLAVASSYTYKEGDIPYELDAIFVHNVNKAEVKPKPKALPTPP